MEAHGEIQAYSKSGVCGNKKADEQKCENICIYVNKPTQETLVRCGLTKYIIRVFVLCIETIKRQIQVYLIVKKKKKNLSATPKCQIKQHGHPSELSRFKDLDHMDVSVSPVQILSCSRTGKKNAVQRYFVHSLVCKEISVSHSIGKS